MRRKEYETKIEKEILEPKAQSPENREAQIIAKAYDLVEQRIANNTASSAEIVFFLKMGSQKERLEKEFMKQKMELDKAKIEALKASEETKQLYQKAIQATLRYAGIDTDTGEEDEA